MRKIIYRVFYGINDNRNADMSACDCDTLDQAAKELKTHYDQMVNEVSSHYYCVRRNEKPCAYVLPLWIDTEDDGYEAEAYLDIPDEEREKLVKMNISVSEARQ